MHYSKLPTQPSSHPREKPTIQLSISSETAEERRWILFSILIIVLWCFPLLVLLGLLSQLIPASSLCGESNELGVIEFLTGLYALVSTIVVVIVLVRYKPKSSKDDTDAT